MKFKNLIKFALALVACLNLASANSLEQIKKDGVIRIATEGVYSPFSFHNKKDELMGYDVEIAKAVAAKLGLKPKFVEASWDAMLAAFDAGKADVVFNQVSITDERKKKYDYSVPYMTSYSAIIVHKDNNDIKSFADLKGKRSTHSVNSMWIPTVEKYGAKLVVADSLSDQINLIITKRADDTIDDAVMFYDYKKQHPNAPIKLIEAGEEPMYTAAIVHKGNAQLLEAINKALTELRAEGKLKEISEKYFGKDISE
nr:amino acid ABC transporter substrate-binding protein [uncultured Campylobacter sp.]